MCWLKPWKWLCVGTAFISENADTWGGGRGAGNSHSRCLCFSVLIRNGEFTPVPLDAEFLTWK